MSTWEERSDAAYRESLLILEKAERDKARTEEWGDLGLEIPRWLKRNWKLLLGILIGYVLAGAAIYLDAWFQATGITR